MYKINTERSSNHVEFILDSKHLEIALQDESKETKENIFSSLKDKNITTIGLSENNLTELNDKKYIKLYDGEELINQSIFFQEKIPFKKEYTYVLIEKTEKKQEIINTIETSLKKQFNINRLSFNNQVYLEVNSPLLKIKNAPLLYLESEIEEYSKHFFISPRVSNSWNERTYLIENQLKKWNEKGVFSIVIFSGYEVEGYNLKTNKVNINNLWNKLGIGIIETFSKEREQKGIETYAKSSNYNIRRIHSFSQQEIENLPTSTISQRIKRAVVERNIRGIYLNVPPETFIENASINFYEILETTSSKLKEQGFSFDKSLKFNNNEITILNKLSFYLSIFVSIGIGIFTLYFLFPKLKKEIVIYSSVFIYIATFILLFFNLNTLVIFISLFLSINTSVYCTLSLKILLEKTKGNSLLKSFYIFLKIFGFLFLSIFLIISMHYSVEYVTYIKTFKGVSISLLLPPILTFIYLFIIEGQKSIKNNLISVLDYQIKLKDVAIFIISTLFLFYYISRTGNSGITLPFELILREKFDYLFGVRPRTKEFLFAFPLLIVYLFYWNKYIYLKYLLPFISIGFASVINTFTHFHTPIHISIIRTFLSLSLGFLIGIFLIINISLIKKILSKTKHNSN